MTVNRLSTNFRERADVIDQITPKNIVQRDISAPAGHWKPAAWLPVQFTRSDIHHGERGFVISSGKVVAMDTESRIVPAGLILSLVGAGGGIAYTATDVTWGVIDVTTGERVTAAVTYTSIQLAAALVERGLVNPTDAGVTLPITLQAEADDVIEQFISPPIGIAAYDMYVWSGLPEDGDQFYTNLSYQHAVQFLTEAQMQLPQIAASSTTSDAFAVATLNTAGTATYTSGDFVAPTEYWNAANLAQLVRYEELGLTSSSPVVGLGLDPAGTGAHLRVARNTDRTPFTCSTSGVLVRQRLSPDLISLEGDWYLDAEQGVLIVHSDTWATGVAAAATWTFSYDYYTETAASAHKLVHFDGPALPGRRVTFDGQSNFVMATEGTTAERNILGQVLRVEVHPKGLLSSVKTGFSSSTTATFQMPGSATKGFPDMITLSDETVADQLVIINVRK